MFGKHAQGWIWGLAFIVSSTYGFIHADTSNYTVIEDTAKLPILTPDFADRKVLKIRLPNGLEAYLISDPKVDKSAAALVVQVGSWQDPDEYPGLAHFLEHMLFLGTKKYPKDSEFDSYIIENDGTTNAYTTDTITSYMFSVDSKALPEALDRFSNFFKEPLFNQSGVDRELHIIDQEYAKNLDNDDIRGWMVRKELGNPKSPFHRFNIGNTSTLSKVSQQTLKDWYQEHYSANLMHLIVYSQLPLDELRDMVVKDFSGIPNTNKSSFDLPLSSTATENEGKLVLIDSIKDVPTLRISWEIPAHFVKMRESQPLTMVCFVLGHEGEESLLAELKRQKLAQALTCGAERFGDNAKDFIIEIELTDKGVKQINDVIMLCFQAIEGFRREGFSRSLFDEIQQVAKLNYEYQTREDAFAYVTRFTTTVVEEPLSSYPEQTMIVQKYDPQAVKELLALLSPKTAHYYLQVPSKFMHDTLDLHEKWMNVPYAIKSIERAQIEDWMHVVPTSQIVLPKSNPFIPKDLKLVPAEQNLESKPDALVPHPTAIVNNEDALIYFAADRHYLVPQVFLSFDIKTPQVDMGNPLKVVLADLYVKSVEEALTKFSYPASTAGLDYKIKRSHFGITIKIDGYSEHADLLLREILKQMKEALPNEQQFEVYKDSLLRDYENTAKKSSMEQASEWLKHVIFKHFTMDKQKAVVLRNKVSYQEFKTYWNDLFKQRFVEGMLYGNIVKEQADQLANIVLTAIGGTPAPELKYKLPLVIVLPKEGDPYYLEVSSKAQGSTAYLLVENSDYSFKAQAAQQIMMQAIQGPFFNELRTKQQTGYIIFSFAKEIEKQLFDFFVVQSNTHAPRDLLARFELFIEEFLQNLKTKITEEQFKAISRALVEELKQPQKNIEEMGTLLQDLAFNYKGDFDWLEKRIKGFEELSYDEFITLSNQFLGRKNRQRVGVLLDGETSKDDVLKYKKMSGIPHLRDLSSYTNGTSTDNADE